MNHDVPEGIRIEVESLLDVLYTHEMSDRKRSQVAMFFIEEHFMMSSMYAIDYLLETIDFNKVPVHAISAVLRTTVSAKRIMPSWDGALNRALDTLKSRNVDYESLLSGLSD